MFSRRIYSFVKFNTTRKHYHTTINSLIRQGNGTHEKISIKGWVHAVRKHKQISFITINDGSCLHNLQVVIPSEHQRNIWGEVSKGCCVEVTGELKTSQGQKQSVELLADNVHIIGGCDSKEYPFKARVFHDAEYIRQYPHLRARTSGFASLLRVRSSLTQALHNVLQEDGFTHIHTPVLTSNDCEGAGEVFQVEPADSSLLDNTEGSDSDGNHKHFFNVPTFLTVSGQLHLETITGAFLKAYTFGPTFRAENQRSRLHLSEFYMLEPELAFISHTEDLINVMEKLIQKSVQYIVSNNIDDVEHHWKQAVNPHHKNTVENLMSKSYVRMTYTEAIDILKNCDKHFSHDLQWGSDLNKEHEQYLVNHCGDLPVFILDFPTTLKPFYMKHNPDGKTVSAVDLLLPGVGEVCGGSLREHDYDVLHHKLTQLQLLDSLQWYLELRKFGTCPHGGFGLGFERLLQAVLGIDNIKDTIPFPRSTHNCKL